MIGSAFTGGTEPPSCPVSPLSLLLFPFGLKNSFLSHLSTTVFSDLLSLSSKLIASFLYLQKPLGKRNLSRRPHHQSRTLFFFIPLHFVFGVFFVFTFPRLLGQEGGEAVFRPNSPQLPLGEGLGGVQDVSPLPDKGLGAAAPEVRRRRSAEFPLPSLPRSRPGAREWT